MKNGKWSKEEKAYLINNYGKTIFKEIKEVLKNRTIVSILNQIKILNLNIVKEKKYNYDLELLKISIEDSISFRDLAKKLNDESKKIFNDYIRKSGLDISHFTQSYPGSSKYKSQIGKRFGKLIVVDISHENKNIRPNYYAVCRCDCGNTKEIIFPSIIRGFTKSCGCLPNNAPKGRNNKNWNGIGEMSGTFFKRVREGAKKRGYVFDITKEYIWELFEKQGRRCILSGIEIFFGSCDVKQGTTASLDRIDNNKGYVKGNVQWVHKDINMMRGEMTVENFIKACKLVTETNLED